MRTVVADANVFVSFFVERNKAQQGCGPGGDGASLREALARGDVRFHEGSIRGAFPQII